MTTPFLQTVGPWFIDQAGRAVMLRGVNLGGNCKIPYPLPDPTTLFSDHRAVSFINRPFPLAEASEHFSRLRHWGLTCLRLLVPWEAVEHAGPGQYDWGYLTYLHELVRQAGRHGLTIFIDPHQDVWSRLTGGDGAPGWTVEAVGFEPSQFEATGAAWYRASEPHASHLRWFTNYTKLATATMFSLFFGGNDFAPNCLIEGQPVQEYLQGHYLRAMQQVARTLQGFEHVVGFGTMNEPSGGFIGWGDLNRHAEEMVQFGPSPTPYQAMLLGAGYPQMVDWRGFSMQGHQAYRQVELNPTGQRAWHAGEECIWRAHGVWEERNGQPVLSQPDYFSRVTRHGQTRSVEFGQDYLKPFIARYAEAIRAIQPRTMIFVETAPHDTLPAISPEEVPNLVNASHWYDGFSLFTALFIPFINVDVFERRIVWGSAGVQAMFIRQLARVKGWSEQRMGNVPTLIGEFGISFNMPRKLNYQWGWFGMQTAALDASFRALEANLLHGTLWNYTSDNTHQHGDGWNGEDLSIFSRSQQHQPSDINSGGRALDAAIRPYPICTAGEPQSLHFDYRRRYFRYTYRPNPTINQPTEIYLPQWHFGRGCRVQISAGRYDLDMAGQRLYHWAEGSEMPCEVVVTI